MIGKSGFTLVEIMIVVAIIGLLGSIAIPSYNRARETVQRNTCLENQRVVLGGAVAYEMDTGGFVGGDNGATLRNALFNNDYIRNLSAFECPASGTVDYNDYALTYTALGIDSIKCLIEPVEHAKN